MCYASMYWVFLQYCNIHVELYSYEEEYRFIIDYHLTIEICCTSVNNLPL